MVDRSFLSPEWYRVAGLKPRLRTHARIFRTNYRGDLWYVLQDRTSGRFHRFSPASYFVVSLLDGRRTLDEVWDVAVAHLQDDTLTQDDVLRLLAQLHAADVLVGDVPPDIEEMAERGRRNRSRKRLMSVLNPLAIRVPLFDPEGFLALTAPLVRPFLSIVGAIAWLAIVGYALALAAIHWGELTTGVLDRVLTAENVILLLIAYPAVKAIHELGHAYAIKRWGGEVHEIGVMFLVFMPIPYVEASSSLSFGNKWKRAFVAGAGILVEMLLAAIAMIVWVNAEPGLVRAFAFNVMLIGGISTIFFNGNPLLRFDGYYVLSDLAEIPNLAQRANHYVGYLVQRRLLGVEDARNPATAPGEPAWFVPYAIAAFVYRLFIFGTICLLVATKFFFLGVVLAVWTLVLMFLVPIAKHVWFLLTSPRLRRVRGRALARVGAVLGAAALVLFALPLPYSTVAEGVVAVTGNGRVIAGADGMVAAVAVEQGRAVRTGDVILTLEEPLIDARVAVLEATVAERRRRLDEVRVTDPARARIAREELAHAEADLALARERRAELTVRAQADGELALVGATDLVGRFVRSGDLLGYVTTFRDPVVHALVPEGDADLVRQGTRRIEMRFVSRPETVLPARIEREVPALTEELPSLALATEGGGAIALDPSNQGSVRRALQNFLWLEVRTDPDRPFRTIGERVYVRFVHEPTPIAARAYRALRQIFLQVFEI